MQKLDKIKEVKVAEQSIEVDPRSNTVSNGDFNFIVKPEQVAVRGTKRMLAGKKKTASVI